MDVGHEAEGVGAEQHAGDDEPGERRELEAVEDENDEQGAGEDDRQVAEQQVLHQGAA